MTEAHDLIWWAFCGAVVLLGVYIFEEHEPMTEAHDLIGWAFYSAVGLLGVYIVLVIIMMGRN